MTLMPFSRLSGCLAVLVTATMLHGCGGTLSASEQEPTQVQRWNAAALKAVRRSLLYVATGSNVYILSYPGGKTIGDLGIIGHNLCSDNNGDVFVPTSDYQVREFSHEGNPVQTLQAGDVPLACAADPFTGNLAVTNEGSGAGEVAIFANAHKCYCQLGWLDKANALMRQIRSLPHQDKFVRMIVDFADACMMAQMAKLDEGALKFE